MRSSTLIALAGVGLLVVAVGAAVLRGTGDDTLTAQPASRDTATETPSPTGSPDGPSTEGTASPTPSGTVTATETATITEAPSPEGTEAAADDQATDPADDAQADTDGGIALGPTDVQDTPQTGGGSLAVLGAALAAGVVVVGRHHLG